MQNREFENRVQQKMEELKLVPSEALWDKVEAELPAEKKRRRWILFVLLISAVFVSSILLKQYYNAGTEKNAATEITKNTPGIATGTENNTTAKSSNPVSGANSQQDTDLSADIVKANEATAAASNEFVKPKKKIGNDQNKRSTTVLPVESELPYNENTNKEVQSKAAVKIKVKAAQPVSESTAVIENDFQENDVTSAADSNTEKLFAAEKNAAASTETQPAADSLPGKDNTVPVTAANKKTKEKTAKKTKWQYGIFLSAGSAAVKNGVFSKQPVNYAQVNSAMNNQPPAGVSNNNLPAAPSASTAFSVGGTVEKNINARFKFVTGVNYAYQSNSIKVGKKVDSAVAVNVDINKSITAGSYYTAGNAEKYKNDFHFIEVPALLQFRPAAKLPFYIEGGITAAVLLHSNALLYNTAASAYVTDAAFFNKMQLSVNAGAGITVLQKTKYPVSIGYQFRQGMLSVTKPAFGKQHFINSLVYAKLMLGK